MSSPRSALALVVTASLLAGGSAGCEIFGDANLAQINVYAAHHARRDQSGEIPDYGLPESKRTWVNDLGWEVNITDGYIVITGATLIGCDGSQHEVELQRGPLPEWINAADRDVTIIGGVEVPEGKYCEMVVEYGPYSAAAAAEAPEGPHPIPSGANIEGMTIFLAGIASKDGVNVDFNFIASGSLIVKDKLRDGDGTPDEYDVVVGVGALKTTAAKTYDRFFDGIDFSNYDAQAMMINDGLMAILEAETRTFHGTTIY